MSQPKCEACSIAPIESSTRRCGSCNKREITEEVGFEPTIEKTIPLETFISFDEQFQFHTYLCAVKDEFIPILNEEHNGYAWVSSGYWPKPLHHGLRNTLQSKINQSKLETVTKVLNLLDK